MKLRKKELKSVEKFKQTFANSSKRIKGGNGHRNTTNVLSSKKVAKQLLIETSPPRRGETTRIQIENPLTSRTYLTKSFDSTNTRTARSFSKHRRNVTIKTLQKRIL